MSQVGANDSSGPSQRGYVYQIPQADDDYDDGSMYGEAPLIEGDFTIRAVTVGLGVGVLLAMSNMYFGLQTGEASAHTTS